MPSPACPERGPEALAGLGVSSPCRRLGDGGLGRLAGLLGPLGLLGLLSCAGADPDEGSRASAPTREPAPSAVGAGGEDGTGERSDPARAGGVAADPEHGDDASGAAGPADTDAASGSAATSERGSTADPSPPPWRLEEGPPQFASEVAPGLRAFVEARAAEGKGGRVWAGPMAGNGGRDVLIYLPPKLDPAAPVRRVVHFHGTYSEHLEAKGPGVPKKRWVGWDRLGQTLDAADRLQVARPENVVVIYPISAGRRIEPEWVGWSNKQYDRLWMKAEDFGILLDEVEASLAALGVPKRALTPGVTVEGHSAGGIALWHVAEGGPDRGADRVSEYIFLDAGFQDWADGCAEAVTRHGSDARVTLVITEGGIADPLQGRTPWCTIAPRNAAQWPSVKDFCVPELERRPQTRPPGVKETCRELEHDARWWPRQAKWCAQMERDMADRPGVFVHRTRVTHGDQIAHYFGGLELPEAWWVGAP